MSRDIANVYMRRTYAVAQITVPGSRGYSYFTPTLLLDGRATSMNNGIAHRHLGTALKAMPAFIDRVERIFNKPDLAIVDTDHFTAWSALPLWDYTYTDTIDAPAHPRGVAQTRTLTQRCHFADRATRLVSEPSAAPSEIVLDRHIPGVVR